MLLAQTQEMAIIWGYDSALGKSVGRFLRVGELLLTSCTLWDVYLIELGRVLELKRIEESN